MSKKSAYNYRRLWTYGFDPSIGKIPWSREWQLLQCSCKRNSMDRGAWLAIIHGVAKSQPHLSTQACGAFSNAIIVKSWSREFAQLCLTFRDPMDCNPPGSSIHGIFYARVLEWVAISFLWEKRRKKKKKWNSCLVIWFLVVPWTVANQAPLSMEFSRQEYWSG